MHHTSMFTLAEYYVCFNIVCFWICYKIREGLSVTKLDVSIVRQCQSFNFFEAGINLRQTRKLGYSQSKKKQKRTILRVTRIIIVISYVF